MFRCRATLRDNIRDTSKSQSGNPRPNDVGAAGEDIQEQEDCSDAAIAILLALGVRSRLLMSCGALVQLEFGRKAFAEQQLFSELVAAAVWNPDGNEEEGEQKSEKDLEGEADARETAELLYSLYAESISGEAVEHPGGRTTRQSLERLRTLLMKQ